MVHRIQPGLAVPAIVAALMSALLLLPSCENDAGELLPTGVLKDVSALPDPAESSYPDCLQVVHLQDIRNWPEDMGEPPKDGVLLAWKGFIDRKLTDQASLIAGDAISFRPVPWDEVDDTLKSLNRADSVEAFDLDRYFVEDVNHVRDFRAEYGRMSEEDEDEDEDEDAEAVANSGPTLAQLLAMPVERKSTASDQRRKRIAAEIDRIETAVAANGGWSAWNAAMKPFYKDLRNRVAGGGLREGDHFFQRTYNHRFSDLLALDEPPALKMLVALDRELARKGIDLLVVPFPLKEEVNADLFTDVPTPDGSLAPDRLRFVHWLLKHDVEVVDLAPVFREYRDGYGESSRPLFYDFEDPHPAQGGIDLAAAVIAERLERYSFNENYQGLRESEIGFEMTEKYRSQYNFDRDGARHTASQVLQQDYTFLPAKSPSSPILLVGDSFSRVPSIYDIHNAGLRDKIALESAVLPNTLTILGSAAETMRNLRREGSKYLDGIEVCVFVFAQYPMFVKLDDDGNITDLDDEHSWQIVPLP